MIENGFEIVSPEEIIIHGSVDGARKWLIAVSRQTGAAYGLLGFEKAEESFNRLASDAAVQIDDAVQARNYTNLFWQVALGTNYGVVVDDFRDLRRQVEEAVYSYRLTTNGKVSARRWWKGFEAVEGEHQVAVSVTRAGSAYSVSCSSLMIPLSKIPELLRVQLRIAENGTIGPVEVREVYPQSGHPRR